KNCFRPAAQRGFRSKGASKRWGPGSVPGFLHFIERSQTRLRKATTVLASIWPKERAKGFGRVPASVLRKGQPPTGRPGSSSRQNALHAGFKAGRRIALPVPIQRGSFRTQRGCFAPERRSVPASTAPR